MKVLLVAITALLSITNLKASANDEHYCISRRIKPRSILPLKMHQK